MISINVSEELHTHFERIRKLAESVAEDEDETASSRAAAMNSVTAILKEMVKIQKELYNSESIALLQAAIVEALEEADQELKDKVLKIVERRLANMEE